MFGDREIHRKLSGAGGYAAERLAEISDSLGQLAKIMKNSGEDPGLSREDGIAALESAASMVCGSCDRCGMKQECLDEQNGEHYFLYSCSAHSKKKVRWSTRTCLGSFWTGAGKRRIISEN